MIHVRWNNFNKKERKKESYNSNELENIVCIDKYLCYTFFFAEAREVTGKKNGPTSTKFSR